MTITRVYPPLTPEDFETQYDEKHRYMFTEDENGDMYYTYGHDRDDEFVRQLREYCIEVGGCPPDEAEFDSSDIEHRWAVTVEPAPEWRFTWLDVTESTPGAFPISVVGL
ncbi:hypothetical protein [Mycobacteroides immunogenum]|uniref:Uncharacterized protein n=1 Tax=Mycobacteroides immunogenum TaxID=83262 RepID=A0A7V8LRC7_9MYCO|nr:hypothetical protein [Mycobacteroides immunogenum]KPG13754.1 hypothetical protein AN909_05795 [Mycobacteroides immunogenum]KPG14254.1 hypothetical protein AN908_06600 [Mycobacteroides immunogenum]KPG14331.1 hypothetical protein AN908_07120 [Mycobacteroides immunogenum]KPG17468.1 hypothetical protein AN910_05020 [Mycobacteroides immunogenum]KPG23947.1 hypothetical protein AN911_00135 [Mycobacteroides immunogenum]